MTMLRTFVAIELSDEARAVLTDVQNRLKKVAPPNTVRWTAPENIHLTLHFLGEVAAADVEKIETALETVAATSPFFSLALADIGCFPNLRRPRIIWTGAQGNKAALEALHRKLGQALAETIGFKPDNRPYSPHLTLGRVKDKVPAQQLAQLGQALDREPAIGRLVELPVSEICLMKSELKPSGPVYTKLCVGKLGSRV
jgi:2'-5' RNA ligase